MDLDGIKIVEHDVIVVGAGGAGLRAAIECSGRGLSTGLVCKSLLGKAHTVMAEGGVAASLANVDERDDWKIHFDDKDLLDKVREEFDLGSSTTVYYEQGVLSKETSWDLVIPNDKINKVKKFIKDNT